MAGPFRRLILRPLIWGLALLALLVAGVELLLRSDWLRERVRVLVEARASEFLGRAVEVGAARFGVLPLELELWNARVLDTAGHPPLAEVEHVALEADWEGLRRPRLTLRRLELDAPVVRLRREEGGQDNMPRLRWRSTGAGARRFQVRIGGLSVRHGRFEFDELVLPLTFDAEGVAADLLGGGVAADALMHGAVSVGSASLTLPRARPVAIGLSGEIEVARGRLDLLAARLRGPAMDSTARGVVRWGAVRSVDLEIEARGSADTLVALGYLREEATGPLEVTGDFHWDPQAWGYQGRVVSPRVTVFERPLEAVEGRLRGDRQRLTIEPLTARYRGGEVEGRIAIDLVSADRPTAIEASFQDVDASAALPDQDVPVDAIAARVSGRAAFRFPFLDPERGEGSIEARFDPLAAAARPPGDARLPVEGSVAIDIGGGELRVASIRAATPVVEPGGLAAQRLEGGGRVRLDAAGGGDFALRLATEEAGQLSVFLEDPLEEPALWVPRRGRGAVELAIALGAAGRETETRVEFDLLDAASDGISAARARGSLRLSERWVEDLEVDLATGPSRLAVAGRIPLPDAAGALAGPAAVDIDAVAWPLADVHPWLPEDLQEWPVDGAVTGHLALQGDLELPSGRFDGAVRPLWAGPIRRDPWSPRPAGAVPLGALEGSVAFDPRRVVLDEARLVPRAGVLRVSGAIGIETDDPAFDLAFTAAGLRLGEAPFAEWLAGMVDGAVEGKGHLGGTARAPDLEADLRLLDLRLPPPAEPAAPVEARRLGSEGGALELRWRDGRIDGALVVPGWFELRGGGALDAAAGPSGEEVAADLLFDLESGDLGAWVALAGGPRDALTGAFGGACRLAIEPGSPLRAAGRLPRFELELQGHRFRAAEPVLFEADGERLAVRSFYLAEPGTPNEVVLAGSVAFADPPALDLRLQATVDASWLRAVAPTLDLQGRATALLAMRGTTSAPRLQGQAELADGRLIVPDFPHAFEQLNAVLLADPDQLVLDEATARMGGGALRSTGAVQLAGLGAAAPASGGGGETAARAVEYRFQFAARDVTLRYPPGWLLRGGADLVLSSLPGGRQVRGVVDLERAFYLDDVDVGLAQLLRGFFARQRLEMEDTDELFSSTQLNVAVRAPGAVRVSNNLARLRGSADLTLRGTAANPVVFGTIEAEPGGELVYNENEYEVTRGRLVFANPYRIEPLVDVRARTRVSQYDVLLDLAGPVDRMSATFTSDPPISDLEVLSLLATGDTTAASDSLFGGVDLRGAAGSIEPGREVTSQGAEAFLAGTAANLVGERVNRLFGFDRFRIAPLAASGEGISAVRVTAGKRLSKDLYVTYSVNPSVTSEQVLTAEWRVAPGLSLVFTQNGDGSYAVDARWETAF